MHAWPELRHLLKREREVARERVIRAAMRLHDAAAGRVTVVFDGRGTELVVEHPGGHATFATIFTPTGLTADDVIEQMVGQAREPEQCIVATADGAERSTVEALGATAISPEELARRVQRAEERVRTAITRASRAAKG